MSEFETPALQYTGAVILGSGEVAAKTFATWLPAPVESIRHTNGPATTWVHHQLAHRPATRANAVQDAVRAALKDTTVPHQYTQTRPNDRAIRDVAIREYGINPSSSEIEAALRVVMAQ